MEINKQYEVGNGWIPLIEDAKTIVSKYNLEHPNNDPIKFTQIKEKWGGLRLYLNYYVPEISEKINELEDISFNICENCGIDKNVSTEWTNGYVYTLCDECRKKELENHNHFFNKEEFLDYPYLGIGEKPDKSSKYASEDKLEKMTL